MGINSAKGVETPLLNSRASTGPCTQKRKTSGPSPFSYLSPINSLIPDQQTLIWKTITLVLADLTNHKQILASSLLALGFFGACVITKVVSNRLKPLLPTLISLEQTGYVEGR